uniref:Uncharacterized protein n=2 Tax=Brassica TaxID=3705 RepID=A0A0D3EEE6_BRAOL
MAPRRKPAAPTYAQLFGDGSGTSFSGPSSSDAVPDSQTSQRVFSSPPLPQQMPPPPPRCTSACPRRCSSSGFACPFICSICEIYGGGFDCPAWTGGIGANNRVSRSVSATIKGYYDRAYPNWSKTPNHVKITWFKCFAANSCSASRRTKDKDGHLPMLHRTGQKPHEGICLEAFEKKGVLPSLSELFKMTHATSDGVFMDLAFEKLFQAVAARIEERETQLTQESPDGLPVTLSTEDADRIFEELAPKKKGRIVGIGSVNEVARATSSYTSRRDEETSKMKARMDSQQVRLDSLEDLLDVMAVGNPVMQRMLSERRAALGLPVRDPQESDPTRQQPSNPTDYFEDM